MAGHFGFLRQESCRRRNTAVGMTWSIATERRAAELPVFASVSSYQKLKRIGEGTYGVVYKAKDKLTGEVVALKRVPLSQEKVGSGLPVTAARELRILQTCRHQNIVTLLKVVTSSKADSVFMVFEYCAHDLGRLLDSLARPFTEAEAKCLTRQLLVAVEFMHSKWVMHRDLKLCNLLLTRDGCLKVCDFGLARYSQAFEDACTPNVVTLWYRAPELLLGQELYTEKVDMWSVGCIMAELLKHAPLFPGRTEISMLEAFTRVLGNPHKGIWPDFDTLPHSGKFNLKAQPYNHLEQEIPSATPMAISLLNQLLTYDPKRRASATQALKHPWFTQNPLPLKPAAMPSFPSTQDTYYQSADKPERLRKRDLDERFGSVFGKESSQKCAKVE